MSTFGINEDLRKGDPYAVLTREEKSAQYRLVNGDAVVLLDVDTQHVLRPGRIVSVNQNNEGDFVKVTFLGWANRFDKECRIPSPYIRCHSDILPSPEVYEAHLDWLDDYMKKLKIEKKSENNEKLINFYDFALSENGQKLADVTMRCSTSNQSHPGHRIILAHASPYFANLFKFPTKTHTIKISIPQHLKITSISSSTTATTLDEKTMTIVNHSRTVDKNVDGWLIEFDCEMNIFELMVNFIYYQRLDVTMMNRLSMSEIMNLSSMAEFLQIPKMYAQTLDILISQISGTNIHDCIYFAKLWSDVHTLLEDDPFYVPTNKLNSAIESFISKHPKLIIQLFNDLHSSKKIK
jgi:hypothetical protein